MSTKTGGSAFPLANNDWWNEGMDMRDYFAGQALSGMLANPSVDDKNEHKAKIAKHAYAFADAMLAEQKKEKP